MIRKKIIIHLSLALFTFIILFFLFVNKENIIPENKFVSLYCQLLIAQDTVENKSNKLNNHKEELLKKYSISEKEYNSTLTYYSESSKNWERFFDKVIKHLEEMKKE